jgi:glycosyltransferase involved in cell wall biosynthesis
MASTPLITVAVAMYQSEDTIEAALESIYSQGFDDLEVVIVNDASTDGSVKKAEGVDSRGIPTRIVTHRENRGLGPSRNTGINEATGRYIVFLDSDDELLPGSLSHIAEVAGASTADLLLVGCVERKHGKDRPMHPQTLLSSAAESKTPWTLEEHPELFFWPPSTWAKVYRREFLEQSGIVFPPGYHQDIPSTIHALLKAQSIGAVDFPCYLYIRRGEGSSATRSKGAKTLVRVEQVKRSREGVDVESLPAVIRTHLVALVSIHLIWGNRAAYRTMPDELHETFFHDSSKELSWWWNLAQPGREVNSDNLMPTRERVAFTHALLTDDFSAWQKALRKHANQLAWRRRFQLSRYGIGRSR